jgi:hypothetical protein
MSLPQQIKLIACIALCFVAVAIFKKAWVSLDECNYVPTDLLDEYLNRTRPDLYNELQICGSHWAEAEIFMRDTGLTILGTDGIVDTRQKLFDYYISKDVNELNR